MLIQDTDSLTYEIETEDVYEDFYADVYFNNYPQYSKFYDPVNINEICEMTDQSEGRINSELIGLMYS